MDVVFPGPKVAVQGRPELGAPALPPADDNLDVRVHEIATKEIRYGAMAAIAITAGVVAAQGLFIAAVMTAAVVLVVFAIESNAEKTFLDLNSPLSTAAKVQTLANSYFWSHAVFASTLAGLTGALAFSGSVAMTVDNLLFKGLALHLLAWLGLAPPAQNMISDFARFGNDATPFIERLTYLYEVMKAAEAAGALNPTLPPFLLGQYLNPNLTTAALFTELQVHHQANGITAEVYFKFLVPVLSSSAIQEFVKQDPEVFTWPFLIEHLSEKAIEAYTGAPETLETIAKMLEDDNVGNQSFADLFTTVSHLQTLAKRLENLPAEDGLNEKRERIEDLLQHTKAAIASSRNIRPLIPHIREQLKSPKLTDIELGAMQEDITKQLAKLDNLPAQVDAEFTETLEALNGFVLDLRQLRTEVLQYQPQADVDPEEMV